MSYRRSVAHQLTQSLLEQLHITSLRSTLLAHLVICAVVREPFACSASRTVTITSQLPPATQNTCYPLLFGRVVVGRILAVVSRRRLPIAIRLGRLLGQVVEIALVRRLGIWRRHLCASKFEVAALGLRCFVRTGAPRKQHEIRSSKGGLEELRAAGRHSKCWHSIRGKLGSIREL